LYFLLLNDYELNRATEALAKFQTPSFSACLVQNPLRYEGISPEEEAEDSFHEMESSFLCSNEVISDDNYPIDKDFPLRKPLLDLLKRYSGLFDTSDPHKHLKADPYRIELVDNAQLRKCYPRRVTPKIQEAIDTECNRLLADGIIVPSSSSVASPVVMVHKPDGSLRMCVDYSELNRWTVDVRFPMPTIRSVINTLRAYRFFGKMDFRQGFHQLLVHPQDRWLTAFVTSNGFYEYTRVPFGLKNAPSVFQMVVRKILHGYDGVICGVFIDDVIVYGRSPDDYVENVHKILQRFEESRVQLKVSKCVFGLQEIEFLGHIVNGQTIQLAPSRSAAIHNLRKPRTVKEVRRFLGMCNAFRDYIPKFAQLQQPLNSLISKTKKFVWTAAHDQSFESNNGLIDW
jgi:putative transposase